MRKYKFGDLVKEVKNKIDRNNNPYEYYVAGDHMDTEDLTIRRRGRFATDDVGPAFIREFKPGQILYGSRRTYLKKVAVADFAGVTANTTFVLESKNEDVLLQTLLPFIMLSEGFTKWSIMKSKGSTNPYVLFLDLADYEFALPEIEEQKKISSVLWGIIKLQDAYRNLLKKTDDLVKSQFIEMFGDPQNYGSENTISLGEISEMVSGGTPSSKHPEYFDGDMPFVSTPFLGANYITEKDVTNRISEEGIRNSSTHKIPAYSLLFGNRVGVGKSSINTCEVCTNQDVLSFTNIDPKKYDLLFIKKILDQRQEFFDSQKRGATIKGIPSDLVKKTKIPLIPLETQRTFVGIVQQSDKSKHLLEICPFF